MKILLDECVPAPLVKSLPGHECETVMFRKWNGVRNGALLRLAQSEFDVFLTADQNLQYEQNLTGFDLAGVQVSTNDLVRLMAAANAILEAIVSAEVGVVTLVEIP